MKLIDADILIKKYKELSEDEWNQRVAPACWACAYEEFADELENADEVGGWISVKDRLPAETHSIFYRFFGTKIFRNSMWREQSDKVLVTVVFQDGTKIVTTGETHDGIWNTTISRTLDPVVTHWKPLPEPVV